MKFGVAIVPHDLKETAVSAKLAEDLGFDYVGIPDSQSLWRELYLSLSVVANATRDRKSTRLNSSHKPISYAVFCLKKKTILSQTNATLFVL